MWCYKVEVLSRATVVVILKMVSSLLLGGFVEGGSLWEVWDVDCGVVKLKIAR